MRRHKGVKRHDIMCEYSEHLERAGCMGREGMRIGTQLADVHEEGHRKVIQKGSEEGDA